MKIVGWIGLSSRFGIRARGQTCTPALRHHFTSNTDSKMQLLFFNFSAREVFDIIYSLLVHNTWLCSKADIVHLDFFGLEIWEEYIQTQNREAHNFFQIFYLFYNKSESQNVEKKGRKIVRALHFGKGVKVNTTSDIQNTIYGTPLSANF